MDNTKPIYTGLYKTPVFYVDTTETSPELFQIKEFPSQLNSGKNVFKLHGHYKNLRENSGVFIEILDYENTPIYFEIPDQVDDDGSISVIIYIDETTPNGNCTVTIVGEAIYVNNTDIPDIWQYQNNVMWQRNVLVNSSKTNDAEITFDKKPTITIQEQIGVQLNRVYNTTQNVIYNTGSVQFVNQQGYPTLFISNGIFTPEMVGGTITIESPINPSPSSKYITGSIPYTTTISRVLSTSSILLKSEYLIDPSQSIGGHRYDRFDASSYSINYVAIPSYVPTENSESYALIEIDDLKPTTGDIARIKVFANNSGTIGSWDLLSDVVLGNTEIFVTSTASIEPYVSIGYIKSSSIIDTYYESLSYNGFNTTTAPTLLYSNSKLNDALYINSTRDISAKNNVDIVKIKNQYSGKFTKDATYKFQLNAIGNRTIATGNTNPIISFYFSGSAFNTDYSDYFNRELPITIGKRIGYLECIKNSSRFDDHIITFKADNNGTGILYYVIEGGQWEISDIHVTTNNSPGNTPNYTRIRTKIPTTHKSGVQQSFKVEYYNSKGVKSEYSTISEPIDWVGGNHYIDGDYNLITGSIFVADKLTTGLEFAGRKNSGMVRTIGYTGWNDKNQGIFIWSGSALTSSTTNYNGVGVEMYESEDNYFRFTTDTNVTRSLDFRTNTFFLGNSTSSISSNGGDIIFSGSITIPGLVLSQSLSDVLSNGNSSGINDIYMGTATSIRSNGGTGTIYMDSNGTGNSINITTTDTSSYATINVQDNGDNPNISLTTVSGSIASQLSITNTSIVVSTYSSGGMLYDIDYSPNYNNRSIVDKQYVDNTINTLISTGTSLYAQTASYYAETDPIFTSLSGSLATTGSNTFSGSQTINGNLTVIGTASFVYTTSSIVQVGANTIILNTDLPASRFGGMTVIDSGSFGNSSTGSLLWDSQNNRWIYSNPSGSTYDGGLLMSGPRNTSGLGNEVGVINNFLVVGQGADHISSSAIFHSESITQVTGSLLVTNGITGSLHGTASWSNNAITASYIVTAQTASYFFTSSVASSSFAVLAGSVTQLNQNVIITGSLSNGVNNLAGSGWTHAEGINTTSSGQYSHAEGGFTVSSGIYSHAEGISTLAIGQTSHAEGQGSVAFGAASHAEGYYTLASSSWSHTEGLNTTASATAAHAEGYFTVASGPYSHAEGVNTIASGYTAHAEGYYTVASGYASHAEGTGTLASGSYSHAEGESTQALSQASHASGWLTIASGSYQTVVGQYNKTSNLQGAFIIGNGNPSTGTRSNLVFASGSTFQVTGSIIATAGFTGSFSGSFSGTATSASFASTSSYVITAQTASYFLTSSVTSASFAQTASYFFTQSVASSSFAQTASSVNILNQNVSITGSLNVSSSITASAFVTTDALITSTTLTANTGITTIYSIPTASYDGAWFDYTIRSGSNARAGTIFGLWSGSVVNYAETTTTDFGSTSNFTFGMSINGSNMILSSSTTTNGWTVNTIIRSI